MSLFQEGSSGIQNTNGCTSQADVRAPSSATPSVLGKQLPLATASHGEEERGQCYLVLPPGNLQKSLPSVKGTKEHSNTEAYERSLLCKQPCFEQPHGKALVVPVHLHSTQRTEVDTQYSQPKRSHVPSNSKGDGF